METLTDIQSFLAPNGVILVGTEIQPQDIEILRANWWYVAPRNGHCSIFTHDALALLGQSMGLTLCVVGNWHAFRPSASLSAPWKFLGRAPDPYLVAVLRAPADGPQSGWHPREAGKAGMFRWTALDRVQWDSGLQPYVPAKLKVIIPYQMEITRGYVEKCEIIVFGQSYPVSLEGKSLTATIQITRDFSGKIDLQAPPPLAPADLNGAPDRRRLGIAIPV